MKKLISFGVIAVALGLGTAQLFSAGTGSLMKPHGYSYGVGYFMNYDYLAGSPSSVGNKLTYGDGLTALEQSFGYGGFALTVHPYAGIGYMGSLGFQFAQDAHTNTGSSWAADDLNSSFKMSLFSGVGLTFPGRASSYSVGLGLHYAYSTMNVPYSAGLGRFSTSGSYDVGQQDFGVGLMTSVNLFNNKVLGMFIAVNYAYDFLSWGNVSSDNPLISSGGYKLLQTADNGWSSVSGGTVEAIVGLNFNAPVLKKAKKA